MTWTLDLTRPRPAWRISSRAPVWKIWRLAAVAGYSADTAPPPARWLTMKEEEAPAQELDRVVGDQVEFGEHDGALDVRSL